MKGTRAHFRAVRVLKGLVGETVSQVGHSVGSAINVGIGPTRSHRSKSRRSIRRPHHRWDQRAETDFLLWTIAWRLHEGGSVRLDGERTLERRIKREIGSLVGRRVVAVGWRDPLLQFTLSFGRGSFLRVNLRDADMSDGNDWTLFNYYSSISKTEIEGRFLISAK